ncbi:lipopolysaccharide core heptose(II) kinase RfaY [Cytophaga sp. FL35]|uniref:lipopolysaccharide core heptose(II) kinase RfaY n=1 Tax=Cytophaga sp. FL35 TaxID=1904456 RepID=UPI001653834A|nr:lipopolysaccharide core heptose(II) kinase RfaY [Cytophaga sp. FL35]MBC6998346.1 protein kinase [Cytophaga sp. FL35]
MDTSPATPIAIRGTYYLPEDVLLTPVSKLPEQVRKTLNADNREDIAITRTFTRGSTKIVDSELAALLSEFTNGSTIPYAIARYCQKSKDEPKQLLEAALPVLMEMISSSILTSEDASETKPEFLYQPGDCIGGYRIIKQLQVFQESEVYKVVNEQNEPFALKIARSNQASYSALLENERDVLNHLHPQRSAEKTTFSAYHKDCLWMVSEWAHGSDITKVAYTYRASGARHKLLRLIRNLIQAYAKIHQQNIVHGDVHPGNVLVLRNDEVRIIDFGHARHIKDTGEPHREKRGGVAYFFEPEYAEKALAGKTPPPATRKSEQFAIASLIYVLATGHYYDDFDLEREAMFTAIANPQPQPFSHYGCPSWPELERLLEKALSKDPKDRFFNVEAMLAALPVVVDNEEKFDDIEVYAKQVISDLSPENEIFGNGLHSGPTCSINGGAGGIAYALLRLSYVNDHPDLLAQSELWLQKAISHQKSHDAFGNPKHEEQRQMVGPTSIHHTEVGLQWLSCLLGFVKNQREPAHHQCESFLSAILEESEALDTTLGKLSVVLALSELWHHSDAKIQTKIKESGNAILSEVWKNGACLQSVGDDFSVFNYGFAHGWSGVLYTSLQLHMLTGYKLPEHFLDRCDELVSKMEYKGRGKSYPWISSDGTSMGSMAGWCNGPTGTLFLFALLYEHFGLHVYQQTVEDLAWEIWDDLSKGIDLCCGAAGKIFALLKAAEVLSDQVWRDRARMVAKIAITNGQDLDSEAHPTYSLFKGQLGLSLACQAIVHYPKITMPMMGCV